MEKTNLQKLIEVFNKNEVCYYEPENLVYNGLVIYRVEVWEDHLTYEGCDEDDKPLTDEVIIAELLKEEEENGKDFLEFLIQLYYNFSNWVRRKVFWIKIVYFVFQ